MANKQWRCEIERKINTQIFSVRCDLFDLFGFHAACSSTVLLGPSSFWNEKLNTHTKWMSNRSAKLCMFSMLCVYLLLFWSSFVIVIIFHSFVFVFPIIFVDASFVELLGSWELIYRFVVGSRNTVCVQCLRGECIECSVLLYFAWHLSNK